MLFILHSLISFILIFGPVRLFGLQFWLESATFHFDLGFVGHGLRDKPFLIFSHLDSLSIHAIPSRVVLAGCRLAMRSERLQHVFLLSTVLSANLAGHFIGQLVFYQGLVEEALMHWNHPTLAASVARVFLIALLGQLR